MSDPVRIQIERAKYGERHWIRPSPPHTNTYQLYRVLLDGVEIGVWRDSPACAAARKLLEMGYSRDRVMQTFRGQTPSMRGTIGWFADRRARDDDRRGAHFTKWRPFPNLKSESEEDADE